MTTGKVKNIEEKTKTPSKKNSTSGGISTAAEVCRIIKACRASGVATFSFNGLSLTFGKEDLEVSSSLPVMVAQEEEIGDNNTDYLDNKNETELLAHDMEEMKIVDPLGYEKFLQEEDVKHA